MQNLKEYKEIYLTQRCHVSDGQRAHDKITMNLLLEFFGDGFLIADLTTDDVENFRFHLYETKGMSKATVNGRLRNFRTIFNHYIQRYRKTVVLHDPSIMMAEPFKNALFPDKQIKPTQSDIFVRDDYFNSISIAGLQRFGEEFVDLLYVVRYLGLRKEEGINLQSSDVFDDHVKVNDEKNARIRNVPLFPEVKHILLRRKKKHSGYLFSYSSSSFYHNFKEAVKLSNVPTTAKARITIQSLRKTFARYHQEKGYHIDMIAGAMGNSPNVIRKWYNPETETANKRWLESEINERAEKCLVK